VANRTRAQYESARLSRWILADVGRELRIARIAAGLRQADVASRCGTSESRICRVEHARLATLSVAAISRHAAAVGLKPSVKLYPLGRRLLDGPQLELLKRFHARIHRAWKWETEVPIPLPGDLRSADCRLSLPGCTVLVEAFTRLSDWQAQSASAARKKRDLDTTRLVLLLAATHANRRAAAEARPVVTGSFPLTTKATMAALAEGRDPGADAIVFL
jgi:transcriptional regulator with XRE-family HTH domain